MHATHHNSPVKNCVTCVHCVPDKNSVSFNECARHGLYCKNAVLFRCAMNDWQPRPPKPARRSLRQWLLDTFWTLNR